jgi:hypothetical protein
MSEAARLPEAADRPAGSSFLPPRRLTRILGDLTHVCRYANQLRTWRGDAEVVP